jgi:Xaa-Pro aminopeptidase
MEQGIALIPSANFVTKSHDTEFPFRQHSDFRYLTGFGEPECMLVLLKSDDGSMKTILFLRDSDPFMEMWMGKRMGLNKATDLLDIDEALPISSLVEKLPELFKGRKNIYFDLTNDELSQTVSKAFKQVLMLRKQKITKPSSFCHLTPLIGSLKLIKDSNEILALKKGMEKTNLAHQYAMAMSNSKSSEAKVNNMINFVFNSDEAEGAAYDNIVAGGENALTLHYIENDKAFNDGDIVLIDAGAQYNGMATDISRSYPVNGKFTEAQETVYELVLDAQKAALREAKPGSSLTIMHNEACKVLAAGLIEHGILKGTVENELKGTNFKKYYPHGTGHWLGLDVHDNCPYLDENNEDILFKEGMVITCEPALYFAKGDELVPTNWQGIGIRIEDDILITRDGFENLSSMIPKEVKEVEETCKTPLDSFSLSFQ